MVSDCGGYVPKGVPALPAAACWSACVARCRAEVVHNIIYGGRIEQVPGGMRRARLCGREPPWRAALRPRHLPNVRGCGCAPCSCCKVIRHYHRSSCWASAMLKGSGVRVDHVSMGPGVAQLACPDLWTASLYSHGSSEPGRPTAPAGSVCMPAVQATTRCCYSRWPRCC
jgi:hypothetical protein